MATLTLHITANADDGCWEGTGFFSSGGFNRYFLQDPSKAFLRYLNVTLPQGTTISNAVLTSKYATAVDGTGLHWTVAAVASDNATAITGGADGEGRVLTSAQATWPLGPASVGAAAVSPTLATVIQEIVNRAGWASGNALELIISGPAASGGPDLQDFEIGGDPTLVITYGTASLTSVAAASGSVVADGSTAQRVNFVGTGTAWLSVAPTITPASGSLGTLTVDTNTTAHANYTPTSSAGSVTFTDSTDGSSTASLTTIALATGYSLTGPTTGATGSPSSNFTVQLTPGGAGYPQSVTVTPAVSPDGTVSGAVTLAANTANASGTFAVTAAADGAHTVSTTNNRSLTNPSTQAYTTSATPGILSDPHLFWAPAVWYNGTTYREAVPAGAYVLLDFADTSIAVTVDLSRYVGASASAGQYPQIRWAIDDAAWSTYQFASSDTFKLLGTSLGGGTHRLRLYLDQTDANLSRFTTATPVGSLMLTGFTRSDGSTALSATSTPTLRTKRLLFFGDSITEGLGFTGWAPRVAEALDAEYGQLGYGGTGWTVTGSGDPGPFFTPGNDSLSYWNKYHVGASRLSGGLFSPAPDYIVQNHGTNDRGLGDMTPVVASVSGWLTACRAAAPAAHIFVVTPFGGYSAVTTAITSGVTAVADSKMHLINLSSAFPSGFPGSGSSRWSGDGLHPNALGAAEIGARVAQAIQAALTTGGGRRKVW